MHISATRRLWIVALAMLAMAFPVLADNVTISGNPNFSSLDGSSLDHDGASNGTFTVDDGNLTVNGTINCNDGILSSACSMKFVVSGNFTMSAGSAIYAEDRFASGNGGNITIQVGGNVTLNGPSGSQGGATISSSRTGIGALPGQKAGTITITAGGTTNLNAGSIVNAGAQDGMAGTINVNGAGLINVAGRVVTGPSANVNNATKYTGEILNGGLPTMKGGTISIVSTSHNEPAVTITGDAVVASQGQIGGGGTVRLEGCNVRVLGLVAALSRDGSGARVVVSSGTTITVDGSDVNASGPTSGRYGVIRSDATFQGTTGAQRVDLFSKDGITVSGPNPAVSSIFSVNTNAGSLVHNLAGTIRAIATNGAITASGNAFSASGSNLGDRGGAISVAARNNVTLNGATLRAKGDHNPIDPFRRGGTIDVRSYSGAVTWQSGVGDVRPVGSSSFLPASQQGKITLTYCTTISTSGTSFPTNGSPVGTFPTIVNNCSPAAPSLPVGEPSLPTCNLPPIANNDAYSVAEGGTLNVPAPGVLGNDTDPNGNPITAVLVSGPANASAFTLNPNGSFTYTHNGGETTTDSFTYMANDGSANSNVATVTITITPVNDAPVANNDSYTVNEGGTINYAAPGVLVNDTDPDGPALTAILVSGPSNASAFTLNPDGSFTYTHDGSETTSDSFTYQVSDGTALSNIATVSITITPVNDAPVANNDSYNVNEGGTLNVPAPGVLGNDTDAEGSTLNAVLVSGPSNASAFTLNADGSFSYTHNGSETTSDSFTYMANDGTANSNVATVTITINGVNDAPVAVNDAYSVNEGGTLNVVAPGVLGNDTDAENDTLTAVLVSGPSNASSFTLNADGSFNYVHNGSETTSDSFTYMANDGTANSNVATVTITINAVNDAPVAVNDSYSVDEGDTLTVAAPGVLGNDTDEEGNTLTAALVSGPANASSFTLNSDGSFTYVHNGSETTSDSFTYMANDGTSNSNVATVTITINPVNEAPTAVDDAYGVNEGGTLTVPAPGVLGNDTDPENDTLNAVLVAGPANASSFTLNADGSFTYTHNGSETLTDSFTYRANDGSLNSNIATVTITITPVNDAPVAVNDAYGVNEGGTLNVAAPGVLGNDTDAENDTLTAVLVSGPANAASFTLNADGSFSYVHNGSETLTDTFTYMANDGTSNSNVATVTITITPVNDAPVANPDSYNVGFHGTLNVPAPGVLGNDTDADGPGLTAVLVSGPSFGSLTLNPDGSFSYTHTGPTLATDSFTYQANDGTDNSNVTTVTINITNQAPTPANDSFLGVGNTELRVGTGAAAHPAAVVAGSVLGNDSDVDNGPSPLTVSAFDATSAAGGSVSMNPNGTFNFLPATGFVGVDTFNYTVSDGLATATATVTITMTDRVWYVNPVTVGPQTGRSTDPFATIGQAQGASAINDYIHVAQGAQATGILLKNGQRLIGSGVALVVGPYTLTGATVRPTLGGTVILASNNLVTGLNIGGIAAGITGSAVNNGTIAEVGVTSTGDGIALTNTTGAFALTNVSLTPGLRGLAITGGSATVTATNLDVTTAGSVGIIANAGTLNVAAGVDGSTVTTTGAVGVNLTNMALNATFRSINASGAANGIHVNNTTGSFTVTGAGVAASGGTIQNTTTRGANFVNAGGVSLAYMNFTNAATANGDTAATCGDTLNGTNTNCNAAIHLQGVTSASLSNVNVSGSEQIGINGNNVANLTMNTVSVNGAGDELLEHGVQFVNLSGTNTVTNSTFSNNHHRQFTVQNSTGTMSLTITGTAFTGTGLPTGSFGALISGHGTANMTVNVQSSTFSNNFGHGYQTDGADTGAYDITVSNNTFTNNGGSVVLAVANATTLEYEVNGNNSTGNATTAFVIFKALGSSGDVSGTISGNTIGTDGVPGSGCASSCDTISLDALGTGNYTVAADNNIIRNFAVRGIALSVSDGVNGNAAIRNNNIAQPAAGATAAILSQSGTLGVDTSVLCSDIQGNVLAGTYSGQQIRVRNRFPTTTYRAPGFPGPGNSTAAMVAFLAAQNGGATATATLNGNTFGGGAACVAP